MMNTVKGGGMAIALACLLASAQGQKIITKPSASASLAKAGDNQLLDTSIGDKISALQLNMLSKEKNKDKGPINNEMLQIRQKSALHGDDDLDGQDILAYSSINADSNEKDEDINFGSGGAIMAALEQRDRSFKKKAADKKPKTLAKAAPKKKAASK